jgi:dipeptidyl aminopeptidase/acylaminoacyl peptidase
MTDRGAGQQPTAVRLLAVRTPMEIEFAPGGSRFAFTLHAVVSEHGVTQPSDLWIVEGDADPCRLTDGPWADTHPVWSPDGSRLACISDRAVAGHHLPYTMVPGEEQRGLNVGWLPPILLKELSHQLPPHLALSHLDQAACQIGRVMGR